MSHLNPSREEGRDDKFWLGPCVTWGRPGSSPLSGNMQGQATRARLALSWERWQAYPGSRPSIPEPGGQIKTDERCRDKDAGSKQELVGEPQDMVMLWGSLSTCVAWASCPPGALPGRFRNPGPPSPYCHLLLSCPGGHWWVSRRKKSEEIARWQLLLLGPTLVLSLVLLPSPPSPPS